VTVHFSPEAEEDFGALVRHLADRSPDKAAAFGRRIFAIIDQLDAGDFDGPEQMLTTGDVVRSWPVSPVRIYYQRRPDAFWVLRIYHQARAPIAR
jgi:plasmid stabilization system protein ParE